MRYILCRDVDLKLTASRTDSVASRQSVKCCRQPLQPTSIAVFLVIDRLSASSIIHLAICGCIYICVTDTLSICQIPGFCRIMSESV